MSYFVVQDGKDFIRRKKEPGMNKFTFEFPPVIKQTKFSLSWELCIVSCTYNLFEPFLDSYILGSPKLGVLYKFKHPLSFKYCGLWRSGGCVILYIIKLECIQNTAFWAI